MAHVVSTRLNDDLYCQISEVAEQRHRKISEIVQEAINAYLEEYEEYYTALERLNDPRDVVITEKELLARLDRKA